MSDYDTDIVAELAALREEQDRLGEAFASALADLRTHQEHILTELEAMQLNQAKILRDEQSKILTGEQFEALRECADILALLLLDPKSPALPSRPEVAAIARRARAAHLAVEPLDPGCMDFWTPRLGAIRQ